MPGQALLFVAFVMDGAGWRRLTVEALGMTLIGAYVPASYLQHRRELRRMDAELEERIRSVDAEIQQWRQGHGPPDPPAPA